MASIVKRTWSSRMNRTPAHPTLRAVARFALVAAAAVAAASLWAQSRPEQGLLLDARTWHDEVVAGNTGPWPADGWYRLVAREQGVEVRAVRPTDAGTGAGDDALFVRLPGAALKPGLRTSYREREVLQDVPGLASPRFSLRVEDLAAGVQYAIGYGGHTYTYLLGASGASTSVRAVADLDGDARPDFLVDVDDCTFLLLSTEAQPGRNLPTAELPAHGGC
jgi:hypothetical protein